MWVILALLGVILAIAVVLVVIGIRNPYSENDMRLFERLGDFSKSGEQVDLEKLELSLPFTERVIYPLARKLGEITLRFTPQNWISRINRRLELAGRSSKVDATVFLTLQFIFGLLIGGFTFTLLKLLGNNIPAGRVFLFTLVMTLLGFYLPHFQLSSSITNRQKQVRKDMPDALDLLTICVEAGWALMRRWPAWLKNGTHPSQWRSPASSRRFSWANCAVRLCTTCKIISVSVS